MKKKKLSKKNNFIYIYGKHPAFSALNNSRRIIEKVYVEKKNTSLLKKVNDIILQYPRKIIINEVTNIFFDKLLGQRVKHQGIALEAMKLETFNYTNIFNYDLKGRVYGVMLDNLNDPHNVGAIYRSAYMFNSNFIITSFNNNPIETTGLLISSSGTYEKVSTYIANNLTNAIQHFKKNGWWVLGLDHDAKKNLDDVLFNYKDQKKLLIVLGSEGKGIRRLIKENCDILIKINTFDQKLSLNVSNAAAIVFNQLYNKK